MKHLKMLALGFKADGDGDNDDDYTDAQHDQSNVDNALVIDTPVAITIVAS